MALPFLPSYLIAKANEPKTVEALEYMKSMNDSGVFDETGALDYEDFTKQIDILNQTGTPLKDSGVGLTTSQEDLSKIVDDIRIKKEEANNKNKVTGAATGTGTSTGAGSNNDEESVEIDKEKFAKLLGSDRARGQDISDMLLSFAGKALKDDATVKSSFSEFFEEEAKRPSRKQKVDDAAAQLAINKYIKGEISKGEMQKLIELNRTKIGDQIALNKAALTFDTALQAGVKNGVGSSKKSIAVIQSAVDTIYDEPFGGPLPESAEDISVGVIYVRDSEESKGAKELIKIDPQTGNIVVLQKIF